MRQAVSGVNRVVLLQKHKVEKGERLFVCQAWWHTFIVPALEAKAGGLQV
jgi:hypothetical protein